MAKFIVKYIAHIVEDKRPKDDNFGQVFQIVDEYNVENNEQLGVVVNRRYESLIEARGLTVFRNGGFDIMPNGTGNIERRIFIPWHMISYLEAEVSHVPEPKSIPPDALIPINEEPPIVKDTIH